MSLNPMLLRLLMISPLLLTAACGGGPEDKKEEPLRVTVVHALARFEDCRGVCRCR